MTYPAKAFIGLFFLALFLLPSRAEAQIQEVKQTVFGMDCAPCAHGLHKRLKGIEGVSDVKVSLKKGLAVLQFEPGNRVKVETIRDAIKESGFAAKDATIRVSGTIENENGQVHLVSATGDRFVLKQVSNAEYDRLKKAVAGKQVVVTGVLEEGERTAKNQWVLQVVDA